MTIALDTELDTIIYSEQERLQEIQARSQEQQTRLQAEQRMAEMAELLQKYRDRFGDI